MNLGYSEQEETLRKMARDFLIAECPTSSVRQMEKDEKGYQPGMWRKLVDLGWTGLLLPEKDGGSGGGIVDLTILFEEIGRAIAPIPLLTTLLSTLAIKDYGTDEQQAEYLPRIVSNGSIITLALLESGTSYKPEAIQLQATEQESGYLLNGTKLFVPFANAADQLLVVARTQSEGQPSDGITLFLVDRESSGISMEQLITIALDKQSAVQFKNVLIPKKNMVGRKNEGWTIVSRILEMGTLLTSAEMLGMAQIVLEMTVAYAKERIQFQRPIGSFEIVHEQIADMALDVDGSRYSVYEAAWTMDKGLPATTHISVAKAWTNQACQRVTLRSHEIHGGLGFMMDHDLQLYTRRAKAMKVDFGDTSFHLERVANHL